MKSLFVFLFAFLSLVCGANQVYAMQFEAYIEDWSCMGPGGCGVCNPTCKVYWGNAVLDVAFSSFVIGDGPGYTLGGLSESKMDIEALIAFVHGSGNGKVKISFGGATYSITSSPDWPNISVIAAKIIGAVNAYGFDGADFDIETANPATPEAQATFANQIISLLQQVRAGLPTRNISLTVPAQGWNTYWEILAKGAVPYVDYINFMEYDIWVQTGTSYAQQIMNDLDIYINQWGISPNKIQVGLMPGVADAPPHYNLSLADAVAISQKAESLGAYGTMIWDINIDYAGAGGNPSLAYEQAVRASFFAIAPSSTTTKFHISKRPYSSSLFERQDPPDHGSPNPP